MSRGPRTEVGGFEAALRPQQPGLLQRYGRVFGGGRRVLPQVPPLFPRLIKRRVTMCLALQMARRQSHHHPQHERLRQLLGLRIQVGEEEGLILII